jgi:hypothetical protein
MKEALMGDVLFPVITKRGTKYVILKKGPTPRSFEIILPKGSNNRMVLSTTILSIDTLRKLYGP